MYSEAIQIRYYVKHLKMLTTVQSVFIHQSTLGSQPKLSLCDSTKWTIVGYTFYLRQGFFSAMLLYKYSLISVINTCQFANTKAKRYFVVYQNTVLPWSRILCSLSSLSCQQFLLYAPYTLLDDVVFSPYTRKDTRDCMQDAYLTNKQNSAMIVTVLSFFSCASSMSILNSVL